MTRLDLPPIRACPSSNGRTRFRSIVRAMSNGACDGFPFRTSNRLLQAALAGLVSMGAQACSGSSLPGSQVDAQDAPRITSSQKVQGLTADGFKALCDSRSGTVEVLAHCGGLATARGFAYDVTTEELSEHTCRGANTCAGWNCITDVPPDAGS